MSKPRVLVVDDDASTRMYLARFLASRGYLVDCLDSGDDVLPRLALPNPPSVVLLDLLLPTVDGLELLSRIKKFDSHIGIVVLTGVGKINTVVKAMKLGASDYLVKPFEEEQLILAITNVLEKRKLSDELDQLRRQVGHSNNHADIVSANPKMLRIREMAAQVAVTDVPVLILGESGVGKEVVARFIHEQSDRATLPFVKVNCAALPHDLLESELFGYERGAFTGALREKPGKFELAGKGTILLDEIGEMTPQLQAKLLHVLQDGEYTRLGSTRSQRADGRILASTNKRLDQAVKNGEFREDLYFRINVIRLEIPPLRDRRDDIPLLCTTFLERYRPKYRADASDLPKELMEAFLRYHWPGNVRQLESAIKRYLILPDLDLAFAEMRDTQPAPAQTERLTVRELGTQAAEKAEKEVILRALQDARWNRKQVARDLNLCYKTLLNKLRRWRIDGPTPGLPKPGPSSGSASA